MLLIWHHVYYNTMDNQQRFVSLLSIKGVPIECMISDYAKVCVAIFLVLSGYGLFKSWMNHFAIIPGGNYNLTIKDQSSFVIKHLFKLMLAFWFIYLLFVPMSIWFGEPFWNVYKGNAIFGLVDFLGVSAILSTRTMNPTWWFMGAIIILYILLPFLIRLFSYSKDLLLVISAVVSLLPIRITQFMVEFKLCLLPFVLGMYLAEKNGFKRIDEALNSWTKRILVITLSLVFTATIQRDCNQLRPFFAIAVICFSFIFLSRIPIIRNVLEFLGKHSSNIFMFHTFIYEIYFRSFIYGFRYSIVIYCVFVLLCLVISVCIEQLKRVSGFYKLLMIFS